MAELSVNICDRNGVPLLNCAKAEVMEGGTLTLTDIHRALTVTLNAS